MAKISTIEELRQILPEAKQTTKAKILPHLDEQALEFVGRSPFLLLGTVGSNGQLEVSPKVSSDAELEEQIDTMVDAAYRRTVADGGV